MARASDYATIYRGLVGDLARADLLRDKVLAHSIRVALGYAMEMFIALQLEELRAKLGAR